MLQREWEERSSHGLRAFSSLKSLSQESSPSRCTVMGQSFSEILSIFAGAVHPCWPMVWVPLGCIQMRTSQTEIKDTKFPLVVIPNVAMEEPNVARFVMRACPKPRSPRVCSVEWLISSRGQCGGLRRACGRKRGLTTRIWIPRPFEGVWLGKS